MLAKTVYVQLDKAFRQFQAGLNGENNNRAQILLAAMKDINDPDVLTKMENDEEFSSILEEIRSLSKAKEVQIMLLAEKYAAMDIATLKSESEAKGRKEGRAEERQANIEKVAKNYLENGLASTMEEAMQKAKALLS